MIRAADLVRIKFTDPATVRLISTAYIDEPAMAPLVDDPAELVVLEEIEGLTSARRSPALPLPDGLDLSELLTEADGYGWTYVNAAFCYTRTTGNRFNGSERGAWYAAYGKNAVQTSQAEVAWHLTRELMATGIFENVTCYRELLAGFTGAFHELTAAVAGPLLDADPLVAYPAGQTLAREVLQSGGNGLLYPSVRHVRGRCLAALRPHLVQNVRQGDTWRFEWAGTADPAISLM